MNLIMPAEFEKKMKEVESIGDIEDRHREADKLLCEVLESLGYAAGTKVFKEMRKWYA